MMIFSTAKVTIFGGLLKPDANRVINIQSEQAARIALVDRNFEVSMTSNERQKLVRLVFSVCFAYFQL